jgi:FKBP-type peptidyl-prolyl cis-trans isomerase
LCQADSPFRETCGSKIAPNSTLLFKVELLSVEPSN